MNGIFDFFMSMFASFVSFIVVMGVIIGAILLPLLFVNGWVMYIPMAVIIISAIANNMGDKDDKE